MILLSHTGTAGENIEIRLSEASYARLGELLVSGQISHGDLIGTLNLLARKPSLASELSDRAGSPDPLTAIVGLVLRTRHLESDPALRKLANAFPDCETLLAADSFLEARVGNFAPLRDRLCSGRASTTFDRAALAELFMKGQRTIDGVLPKLLPRGNRERAALLGLAFGLPSLSPASLSRAMAPGRKLQTRAASWKTVHARWNAAERYEKLRPTRTRSGAMDDVAGAGYFAFRPSQKTLEAAVTAQRKGKVIRRRRTKADLDAIMKIYLRYRILLNPQSS